MNSASHWCDHIRLVWKLIAHSSVIYPNINWVISSETLSRRLIVHSVIASAGLIEVWNRSVGRFIIVFNLPQNLMLIRLAKQRIELVFDVLFWIFPAVIRPVMSLRLIRGRCWLIWLCVWWTSSRSSDAFSKHWRQSNEQLKLLKRQIVKHATKASSMTSSKLP